MYTLYLYTEDSALAEKYNQASRHFGDAGIDLYCPSVMGMITSPLLLGLQIRCRMTKTLDNGEEKDVSYYLYPRSSLAKTRLRLSNSVGIIDSGYRGEIMAAFDVVPVVRDNAVYEPEEISLHQRLVQICSPTLDPVQLVVVDSPEKLNLKTERGSGGFGSTGK